ncbi:MAG: hypothetical protein MR283_04095 [Erysipelotrichaceae bacterium]|nr:hypothetical protein [Erysipelotrichaceae bacterium]MDY6035411.1 hypothetical protein [Bulleidia sp.]
MAVLTKYEQETIINFNVAETDAVVYTRDKAVMRKLDALVNEFPEVYKCLKVTDIDKTYSMPKKYVKYRKPRRVSEKIREQRKEMMQNINNTQKNRLIDFNTELR